MHWFRLRLRVPAELTEAALALLWERPLTGLEEEGPGQLVAFSSHAWDPDLFRRDLLRRLTAARPPVVPPPEVEVTADRVEEQDWLHLWKENWRPTPLGRSLLVVPAWWDEPIDSPRVQIRIDPGAAFGTGAHITTALAWELLEDWLETCRPRLALDVGAGSGILSLGMQALHPSLPVVGTEMDPGALASWRANIRINRAESVVVSVLTRDLPFSGAVFDLAAANLTEREHQAVAPGLARVLCPGARLVISGLLSAQVPAVSARWRERGFHPEADREREGWGALRLAHA